MDVMKPEKLCQITIVVKDLERVAKNYAELLGVEVPLIGVSSPYEISKTRFKGVPTNTVVRMCNFNMGQVVLELLEPDGEPSTWKDFLDTHGQGVHNIGFMVDDREKAMKFVEGKEGTERFYGEYPGGNYTIVDTQKEFGVYFNVKYEEE
ncbi:MAG: VOC family protein [Christensenellales bacterium]|jgi:methylmalonyl-CoA/ethylmalonyl-CoA epimerase